MRVFVAVEPTEPVALACGELIERMQRHASGVRWSPIKNIHLTLRFFGVLDKSTAIPALIRALSAAAPQHSPYELRAVGVGCFPAVEKPSVVWAGIQCRDNSLTRLQSAIEDIARHAGLAAERRAFHPHMTLGRIRVPAKVTGLEKAITSCDDWAVDAWQVRDVALFASELHPSGARYDRLATFPLGMPL